MRYLLKIILICLPLFLFAQNEPYLDVTHSEIFNLYHAGGRNTVVGDFNKNGKMNIALTTDAIGCSKLKYLEWNGNKYDEKIYEIPVARKIDWIQYDEIENIFYIAEARRILKFDPIADTAEALGGGELTEIDQFEFIKTDTMNYFVISTNSGLVLMNEKSDILQKKYFGTILDFKLGNIDDDEGLEIVLAKNSKGTVLDLLTFEEKWDFFASFGHRIVLGDFDQDGRSHIFAIKSLEVICVDGNLKAQIWAKTFDESIRYLSYNRKIASEPSQLLVSTDHSIFSLNPETNVTNWEHESFDSKNVGLLYADLNQDDIPDLFYVSSNRLVVHNFEDKSDWVTHYKKNYAYVDVIDYNMPDSKDYYICSGSANQKGGLIEVHEALNDSIIKEEFIFEKYEIVTGVASVFYMNDMYHIVNAAYDIINIYKNDFSNLFLSTKESGLRLMQIIEPENSEPYLVGIDKYKAFAMYSFVNGSIEKKWSSTNTENCVSFRIGNYDADSSLEVALLFENSIELYDLSTFELQKQIDVQYYFKNIAFEVGDFYDDGSIDFLIGGSEESKTQIQVIDIATEKIKTVSLMSEKVNLTSMTLINLDTTERSELLFLGERLFVYDMVKDSILGEVSTWRNDNLIEKVEYDRIKVVDLDLDKHLDILVALEDGYFRARVRDEFTDIIMPYVRSYFPNEDQKKASTDITISVLFSEEIDSSTLSGVEVFNGSGLPENFEITQSSDLKTLFINPIDNWASNSIINVKLLSSIEDLAGNRLDGNKNGMIDYTEDDFEFSFITGSGVDNFEPKIKIIESEKEEYLDHVVTIVGEVTDKVYPVSSIISELKYSLDNPNVYTEGKNIESSDMKFDEVTENFRIDLETKNLSEGEHMIYLAARDYAGNWSQVKEVKFTLIDNTVFDWSLIGKDLYNTSNAYNSTVKYPLSLKYSFSDGLNKRRSIIVANKLISVSETRIWMRDLITGEKIWENDYDDITELSVPCFYKGDIYVQLTKGIKGELICLNFDDGSTVWNQEYFNGYNEEIKGLLASDGKIIMLETQYKTHVSAFSATTGKQLWKTEIHEDPHDDWIPAIHEGKVYCYASNFRVLDLETGEILVDLGKDIIPYEEDHDFFDKNPVIDTFNNQVILVNRDHIYGIDLDTYAINWDIETDPYWNFFASPALSNNSLFIGNIHNVVEFDATTGEQLWINKAIDSEFTPVVTDSIVIFSQSFSTVVMDRNTKKIKGGVKMGGAISLANDLLIINGLNTQYILEEGEVIDTISATVHQLDSIQCFGDATASIEILVNGANGNLNYTWEDSPYDNTSVREDLKAGKYFVSVYDEDFKNVEMSFDITEPEELVLDFSHIPETDNESNGIATVLPMGGTKPYNYIWSDFPGVSIPSIPNLKAGNYEVEVIDINGCSATITITVSSTTPTQNVFNEKEIMIIPTISTGDFQVKVESKWVGSYYSIYNQVGKEVDKGLIIGTLNHFETQLPSGFYYLSLEKGNRTTDTKFVIAK